MADKKITQLPEALSAVGSDVFPIVNEGTTKKLKLSAIDIPIRSYVQSNFVPLSGEVVIQGSLSAAGNLTVGGNLNVQGAITQIDTTIASTSAMVIDTNTSETALRITQRGSGDVLRVEDQASDTTPFVINADGRVGIGIASPSESLTVSGSISASNASNIPVRYNTAISDSVSSIAVGGATAQLASFWKTKTIHETLDMILFPDLLPTYTIPTISITTTHSGTREVGETISPTLAASSDKNDAGRFTTLSVQRNSVNISTTNNPTSATLTNIAAQFGFESPNNPNARYTLSHTDSNFVIPAPTSGTSSSTTWRSISNYSAGLPKNNNKGAVDTRTPQVRSTAAPQAAGNDFASSNVTVTGIYPWFWGKAASAPTKEAIASAIQAGTTTKELSDASGTVTVTNYAANGEFIWIAIPSVYTNKTKWFNTDLNQGNIGAGNFILSPVTQTVTSPQGFWTGVNYRIYISAFATTTSGSIQFRN